MIKNIEFTMKVTIITKKSNMLEMGKLRVNF